MTISGRQGKCSLFLIDFAPTEPVDDYDNPLAVQSERRDCRAKDVGAVPVDALKAVEKCDCPLKPTS